MSNYWIDREARQRKYLLNKGIDELNTELKKCYYNISRRIMVEMEKLYLEVLETTDGKILVSHLYQFNRYYELLNKITEELRKLGHLQTNIFRNAFENMYINNQAIIGASFHLNSEINYDEVEKAINDI